VSLPTADTLALARRAVAALEDDPRRGWRLFRDLRHALAPALRASLEASGDDPAGWIRWHLLGETPPEAARAVLTEAAYLPKRLRELTAAEEDLADLEGELAEARAAIAAAGEDPTAPVHAGGKERERIPGAYGKQVDASRRVGAARTEVARSRAALRQLEDVLPELLRQRYAELGDDEARASFADRFVTRV